VKRHPAFVPLSRDHHHALVLARGLQTDGPAGTLPAELGARVAHTVRVFVEELEPHFRCEEDVLLSRLRGRDPELDRACDDVQDDHETLRAMIAELTIDPNAQRLDAFGRKLEAHVRLEERALFETAQRVVPEDELARLEALVEKNLSRDER